MTEQLYEKLSVITNLWSTICALLFVLVYGIMAPWRKSELGRHVMLLCSTLAFIMGFSIVIRMFPDSWEYTLKAVRQIVVAFVGVLLIQRTRLVIKAQRRRKSGDTTVR